MLTKTQSQSVYRLPTPVQTGRLHGTLRALAEWATLDEYDKVLDADCESGMLLSHLMSEQRVRACGICESIERARAVRDSFLDADVVYGRKDDIPWSDETFDAVLCGKSYGSLDNADGMLRESLRVLKPGGHLLINAPWLPKSLKKALGGVLPELADRLVERDAMMKNMEACGFENVSWRASGIGGGVAMAFKPKQTVLQED